MVFKKAVSNLPTLSLNQPNKIWTLRLCEISEGEGENENYGKGSTLHCYSTIIKCGGRAQWQSGVASMLLSAHFKRWSGLLGFVVFQVVFSSFIFFSVFGSDAIDLCWVDKSFSSLRPLPTPRGFRLQFTADCLTKTSLQIEINNFKHFIVGSYKTELLR